MNLRTYVSLRVFSDKMTPEDIDEALGIVATDRVPIDPGSKYRDRREYHYWSWSTENRLESLDNLDHVHELLKLLEGKKPALDYLKARGCDIDVWCLMVTSGQGGPFLDVAALTALAHFELEIAWDIYFAREDEFNEAQ